jgi:hypothetical protein
MKKVPFQHGTAKIGALQICSIEAGPTQERLRESPQISNLPQEHQEWKAMR